MLVDVSVRGLTGKDVETYLDEIGITVNKNTIPFDKNPPTVASGIRVGTPAITTRGMTEAQMREIADIMGAAMDDIGLRARTRAAARARLRTDSAVRRALRADHERDVAAACPSRPVTIARPGMSTSWRSRVRSRRARRVRAASVGAVIVKDKRILATGYNGAPVGMRHCDHTAGGDMRDGHCARSTHAEQNALVQAARHGTSIAGGTMYCTDHPCLTCAKLMINAGLDARRVRGSAIRTNLPPRCCGRRARADRAACGPAHVMTVLAAAALLVGPIRFNVNIYALCIARS